MAQFTIGPDETLPALLALKRYAIGDVTKVVLSHLHQDHIGGLRDLRHADVYVSRTEWNTLAQPFPLVRGLMRRHIDLPGLRWQTLDLEAASTSARDWHDLMGDGSLMILPTPGHTPGSMSMLITGAPGDPLLLVGDLTYSCDLLHADVVPGVGNAKQLHASNAIVRELEVKYAGLRILAAHDSNAGANLMASGASTTGLTS